MHDIHHPRRQIIGISHLRNLHIGPQFLLDVTDLHHPIANDQTDILLDLHVTLRPPLYALDDVPTPASDEPDDSVGHADFSFHLGLTHSRSVGREGGGSDGAQGLGKGLGVVASFIGLSVVGVHAA